MSVDGKHKYRQIRGHTVIYNVNKDKRVVTACVVGCKEDAFIAVRDKTNIVRKKFPNRDVSFLLPVAEYMKNEYWAKAKCNPDDAWNEEIGKKIAYLRLREKYYKDLQRILWDIVLKTDMLIEELADICDLYTEYRHSFGFSFCPQDIS